MKTVITLYFVNTLPKAADSLYPVSLCASVAQSKELIKPSFQGVS